MDFETFINTCNLILSSQKFLIATQQDLESSKWEELQNYIPSGFVSIEDLDQVTSSGVCKFIRIPIRLIDA